MRMRACVCVGVSVCVHVCMRMVVCVCVSMCVSAELAVFFFAGLSTSSSSEDSVLTMLVCVPVWFVCIRLGYYLHYVCIQLLAIPASFVVACVGLGEPRCVVSGVRGGGSNTR